MAERARAANPLTALGRSIISFCNDTKQFVNQQASWFPRVEQAHFPRGRMAFPQLPVTTANEAASAGIQRRQSSRRRVLKNALIVFEQGKCTMRSRILDVSDTGALLAPSDVLLCPKEFVLKPDVG